MVATVLNKKHQIDQQKVLVADKKNTKYLLLEFLVVPGVKLRKISSFFLKIPKLSFQRHLPT